MKNKKVKSSLYYPYEIHQALKRIFGQDIKDRKFNQIVIDIIADHPDVKAMVEKIRKEKESDNK